MFILYFSTSMAVQYSNHLYFSISISSALDLENKVYNFGLHECVGYNQNHVQDDIFQACYLWGLNLL